MEPFNSFVDWCNDNSGFLGLVIFFSTLFLGWVSGIFSALRRKPKLMFSLKEGPTFFSVVTTGKEHNGHEVHRTAIALYLNIVNVGAVSTSVEQVQVGYHWFIKPFSLLWLRYRFFWHWIKHPTIILDDFQYSVNEDRTKIYPFLFQGSYLTGQNGDTYLQPGQSVNGVIYFEGEDAYGGCAPAPNGSRTKICVKLSDSFGNTYCKNFYISLVSLEEGQKYNPSYGLTFNSIRGDEILKDFSFLPKDLPKMEGVNDKK